MRFSTKLASMAVAAGLGVAALLAPQAAQAAPMISARVFDNGVPQALGGSSNTGLLNLSGSTTNFSISLTASGVPLLNAPGFSGVTTSISTSVAGTHTFRIELTQTDVSSASAGSLGLANLASTLTTNLLNNAQFISGVKVTNYADGGNIAYGTATMLAMLTAPNFVAGLTTLGPVSATAPTPGALFSETIVIEGTFSGQGANLQVTSQITAAPEPASLALLGAGLLGLAAVRRRKAA